MSGFEDLPKKGQDKKPSESRVPEQEEDKMENRYSISELEEHRDLSFVAHRNVLALPESLSGAIEFFGGEVDRDAPGVEFEFFNSDEGDHLSHDPIVQTSKPWRYPDQVVKSFNPPGNTEENKKQFLQLGAENRSLAAVRLKSSDDFELTKLDTVIDPKKRDITYAEFRALLYEEGCNGSTLSATRNDGKGFFIAFLMRPDNTECIAVAMIDKGVAKFLVKSISKDADLVEGHLKNPKTHIILPLG